MRIVILLASSLLLLACDTMSLYRIDNSKNNVVDVPTPRFRSRQTISIDNKKVNLTLFTNRFNFGMYSYLEILNRGDSALEFDVKSLNLQSESSIILPLKRVQEATNLEKYEYTDIDPQVIKINPGESRIIVYTFNGGPVMKATHIQHSKEQEVLYLKSDGLSRNGLIIPINLKLNEGI